MLFVIKKIVAGFLLPYPLILLLMGIALLCLWLKRCQKSAVILLSLSWFLLFFLSSYPVSERFLNLYEQQYATYNRNDEPIDFIVVLGGSYTYNPDWAPSSNIINNSLPRITEGIRQYLRHPNAKLIFTGGNAEGNPRASSEVAADVAISLGVSENAIIRAGKARDTDDEANVVAKLVGDKPFLLVTSAYHLPRAMKIFQAHGMSPIAAPSNQMAIQSPLNFWEIIFPSPHYLYHSDRAWHETIGLLWLNLKRLFVDKENTS